MQCATSWFRYNFLEDLANCIFNLLQTLKDDTQQKWWMSLQACEGWISLGNHKTQVHVDQTLRIGMESFTYLDVPGS